VSSLRSLVQEPCCRLVHGRKQSKKVYRIAILHPSHPVCQASIGGPKQVLRYLARYTHRVAISNRRLISADDKGVTFKWKDYRLDGAE
jgi:hypothetical protein